MKKYILYFFALSFVFLLFNAVCFAEKTEMFFQSVYPQGHMRFKYIEDVLDKIEEQSQGRIHFYRHYQEPIESSEALTALGRGTIDILVAYPVYYSGRIAVGDWQQMPSNFRGWEDCYELAVVGKIAEIMDKVYRERANAVYLGLNPIAPYNFQVAKRSRKINNFNDFKGLKIRAAGGAASLAIESLGAFPVQTVAGEYYEAMQRGMVDAGLMTTYSLEQYQIWEVADQLVDPPLIGYSTAFIWMNQDTFNNLEHDLQEIFIENFKSKYLWRKWVNIYETEQDERILRIAKERGVELFTLPDEEAEKMFAATIGVWDWYVEQCEKQRLGDEAEEVKILIMDKFYSK